MAQPPNLVSPRARTTGVVNPVYLTFLMILGAVATLVVATVFGLRALARFFRSA